jgi:hypothetical protein
VPGREEKGVTYLVEVILTEREDVTSTRWDEDVVRYMWFAGIDMLQSGTVSRQL